MQGRRWAGSLAAAVLCLAAAGAISEAHATTPSVSSVALNNNNDGTWAGVLTINLNTPMEWQTSKADALSKIVIKRGHDSGSSETRRATGSDMEFDGNSVKVYYAPLAEDIIRQIGTGFLSLYIDATALQSADTQTALPQYGVPGLDGVNGPRVPSTDDETKPQITTLTLDRASGALSIVTDEALTYGAYAGYTFPSNLYIGNDDNSTKFHIRDGATASSGGITMNKDDNDPSVHRHPPHEIRFVLTPGQVNTVVAYAHPHLHVDVEAFSGIDSTIGRHVSQNNAATSKAINFLPRPAAADLLPSTRALTVTFDEAVTRENGAFYIRDSASGDYDLATDVAGVLAISGTVGTSTLTSGGVAKVQSMSTPHLHLEARAVKDSEGAANGKAVVSLNIGTPPPRLSAATIDRASGAAALTFDKAVTKGTGDIDIRDGVGAAHDAATDVRVPAGTVSASGSALAFTLSAADLAKVNAMSSPHVYLGASAAVDSGGTGNDALASGQDAVLSPRLASAHLAPSSLTLSATFSERVAAPPSSPGRVYVGPAGDAAFTPGTDVHLVLSGTAVTHSAKLTAAEYARVAAMSTPTMYAEANAATVSGLSNAALSVPLTIEPPRVTHTRFDFNSVPGVVTITFSYDVTRGAGSIDMLDDDAATYNAATHVRLSVADATVSGNQLIFTLTEAQRQKGLSGTTGLDAVRLPSGAVSGLGGDNPAESRSVDLRNLDGTSPLFVSASLNDTTGVLTLRFNETMDASTINLANVRLQDGASASGGTALSGATVAYVDGVDITVTLTSGQRTAAAGYADLHVRFVATDAIRDTSNNQLFAVTKAVSTTNDTAAPTLSSAALDEGTGILTLTFSETIDVSSATDGAQFEIRDGASATDNLASEAVLSTAEIQSGQSDGTAFKFVLNETSRQAVISMSNPHMYIAAGAITDTATPTANSIAAKAAGTDISQTFDDDAPSVSSADMHEDTGVLTATFSETVDVSSADGAKFEIRDGASATDNLAGEVVLSAAEIQQGQSDGLELKFNLNETSRQGVIALGDPHLYAAAGAINDAITMANSGVPPNAIAADADGTNMDQTPDTSPPEVSSVALDEGTGILTITFDETVDVSSANGAQFELRDGASATDNLAGEVVLSTAEIQSGQQDGAEFKFELTEDSRQGAIAMTAPHLYVAAGAINDAITMTNSGVPPNAIAANTDGTVIGLTPDGAAPTIVSAEATALNKITVTFSEKAKTTNTGGEGWSVSGTDAGALQVTQNSDISSGATEVVLTLSGNLPDTGPDIALRYEISGTDVGSDAGSGSGAVTDTSNNALAARSNVAVSDGIKPEIVSSRITGPNEITIAYSEAVTAAQSDYASALVGTARTISGLSGGTTDTHTLTFSGTAAGPNATGSVTLDATQIQDAAGNALGTSASLSRNLADGQTSDISSAVLDMQFDNPRLVLSFDGPVDQSSFDPTKIFVTNSTPQKTRGSVDLSQAPTFSGNEVTIGIKKNIDGASSLTDAENEFDGIIRLVSGYRMEARAGAWAEPGGASNAAGMYSVEYRTSTSTSLTSFEPRKSFTAVLGANDRLLATADDGLTTEGFAFRPMRNAWTGHVFLIQDGAVVADKREYGTTNPVSGTHPRDNLTAVAAFDVSVLDRTKDTTVRVEYHPSSWLCVVFPMCLSDVSSRGYVAEKTVGYQEISIPQLSSARIGDGMLVLGFDVDMDVELSDLTKASVREKGTTSPVIELANSTLTAGASGSTILVDLGANLDGVQSMTQPELVLQSAAFSAGPSRETEAATADIAKDTTAPSVSSVTVASLTTVEVQFSERVRLANTGTAPFGWTISGADAESRQVSSISGITTGSVAYSAMLTLDGNIADSTKPSINVAYSSGNIEDMAGNALAAYTATPAGDGIAPTFTAKATAPDEITVTFSEDLSVSDETGQGWSISGTDAPSHTVDSSTPVSEGSSVILTLSSDLADTRPDGVVLRYETSGTDVSGDAGSGSGTIQDPSSNTMEPATATVSDGLAPAVSSAKYTSRNSVEVTFSEPVRLASGSVPSGWHVSGADRGDATEASAAAGLPTSDSAPTATLTLDNNLADKTNLDFTLSYASGNLEDVSGNSLASYSASPSDGIAPAIVSAESRALNEITVIFSEAVSATSTGASATWQLSGAGLPAGVTVSGNPAISASSTVLTLSGNLSTPIGVVELAYVASAGDIRDGSSNALAAQSVSVSQNLPPTISSAKITGPNQATITYSEPVTASAGAYSGLTVGTARSITSYTQTSAAAHVLVFGGPSAGTGASGTLTIDQSKISDGVLNLGTSSAQRNLTDGQVPTFSAGVTDSRTVLVTFSEQVSSSDNAASHWTLSGADAQAVSSVSALSNSGTMAIAVGADFAANVADLKISYSAAGTVSDSAGNALASVSNAVVSDEQRPSIASAVAGTDNSITVTLTRNSSGSATDAGTTWTLSGTDAAGLSVSGYPGISSDTVILGLSGSLPDTAPNLSLSYNAGAGDIADAAGKQMIDQTVPVSDGLKPRIDGAALNEGTGVLTVTFTEPVTVASGLHLRESGSAGGIPLPSSSGTVLSFTLSEAQRQQALAFATPSLRMEAGAAADGAGLSSDAADVQVSATADAVPPVASSAFLDLGTGILTISFDENLGPASNPSLLSISGSLTGAQVSVSGSTATVELTEQQRQAAIGLSPPSLVLGAGAFRDVSGTGSAPATLPLQTAPDDDRPRLVTAALNTDTSTLVLEFDETMDASAFGAQLSHVRITGGAQEIPVSGTVSLDGVKVRVQVDRATLNAVLDSISSSLRLETRSAQFEDTSGNAAPQADVELAIGDDSPPRLVSASVISPDTVLAIFHEDLDGSTVAPSDFDVGGLTPLSVSEERGTVTLKLDSEYDERDAPTVSLAGSVSDLFGNAQNSGSVQSVNNIVRVTVSEFTVSASGGLAVAGEQVSISFRATEPVQNPALSINGEAVPVTPAENGFTASYIVPAGSPQGPLSVSLSVESRTGTPASFTERDLTGPNVSVDTVPPQILSASASGTDSATIRYSEPVLAGASGASAEVSSVTYTVSVSGSGSETVLVYWDGDGTVPASAVLRGLGVRDIAGNPSSADPVNAGAASDTASPGPTGVLPIAKGTTLRTVTVPAGTEPALELSSASATDPRVLFAGGRTAELENPLSVITREPGLPDLFFQAGTEVGGLAGLTVAGADLEAAVLVAQSDYEVPSGSPALDAYPQLRNPTTSVLVGSPASDIAFSKPVRMEFDIPLSGLVFTVNASGDVLPIPACAEGYGGAVPLLQEAPDAWPPETYDPLACVSDDSVWTMHFSVFGVAYPSSGGSECDDCTPPTLGYDAYGARLVDGGFAYNGLASDVEYFFTPYPLIESEVGEQNTISLKIYENEGPQNIQHVSIAFGLRSGEVISESKAVINYDILHDGTGALSVIDPENAIGDSLSASHEVVECAAGSALECLSVTVSHSFRAPLEFDIVGTDVWDSQRNSWQNYFNHGLRITGESMNPVPGVAVNGGELVLHPIVENSNNVEVMASQDGQLYRLAPDGLYEPLRNISSLFHSIDESMYTYRGIPMQGYDRSDPEFAGMLEGQIDLAKAVLERMNLGRQGWHEGFEESEQSVHAAIDRMERLQESLLSERERAERTFLERYGPTDRPE